jgi:hypothetical protein
MPMRITGMKGSMPMFNEYSELVKSELLELETRDIDALFECIRDNIEFMYDRLSVAHKIDNELLHETIEHFVALETVSQNDALLTVAAEAAEFLAKGTSIHPGSLVANELVELVTKLKGGDK